MAAKVGPVTSGGEMLLRAASRDQAELLSAVVRFGRVRVPADTLTEAGVLVPTGTLKACISRGFLAVHENPQGRPLWTVTRAGAAAIALGGISGPQMVVLQAAVDGTLFRAEDVYGDSFIGAGGRWEKVTRSVKSLTERDEPLLRLGELDRWTRPWHLTSAGVAAVGGARGEEGTRPAPPVRDPAPVSARLSTLVPPRTAPDHALVSALVEALRAVLQWCGDEQAAAVTQLTLADRGGREFDRPAMDRLRAANAVVAAVARKAEVARWAAVSKPKVRPRPVRVPNRAGLVEILGAGVRAGVVAAAGTRSADLAERAIERLGDEWDTLLGFALDGLADAGYVITKPGHDGLSGDER